MLHSKQRIMNVKNLIKMSVKEAAIRVGPSQSAQDLVKGTVWCLVLLQTIESVFRN